MASSSSGYPTNPTAPALIAREESEITTLRWSPDGLQLAYGTSTGHIAIHTLTAKD
jgi:hypothetical protein